MVFLEISAQALALPLPFRDVLRQACGRFSLWFLVLRFGHYA